MAPPAPSRAAGVGVGVTPRHLVRETVRYLERLRITQGARAGERFAVLPWQRRFLRGALADGVYESALTMARGGGKTTFIAGLGCAAVDGPLAQPNAEVIAVAASLGQARIIFRHVLRFLAEKIERKRFRVWDTVNRSAIQSHETGVLLELKGANPATMHGLAPSVVICDEIAQWKPNVIDAMLAALDTSLGKIPGGRFWKIGTRAASGAHPFEVALRTADYVQRHAARPDDPPFHRRTWERACPSLRDPGFAPLLAKIRKEAKKARKDESLLASFRALRLNLGVSDVAEAMLIELDDWKRAEASVEPSGAPVWGVDLGTTAASSAVSAYWPRGGRLDVVSAFPREGMTLAERGLRDGVGSLYREQYKRGELILTPGHACDAATLLREALQRFGRPSAVAADRWREGELRDALHAAGVPMAALVFRGMGYRDGSEDVRAFRRAIAERKVFPVVSLVLRSAMAEARTVSDPAGNAKLAKQAQGGRRALARDDAAAAAILAVAEGSVAERASQPDGAGAGRRPLRVEAANCR